MTEYANGPAIPPPARSHCGDIGMCRVLHRRRLLQPLQRCITFGKGITATGETS
jgi:hypothetical protein